MANASGVAGPTVHSADRNLLRVFRPRRWLLASIIAVTLPCVAGAMFTLRHSGWTFVSVTFVGMSIVACAGILEVATSRVVLGEASLESGSVWSHRRYAVADIVSVTWEAGAGVTVKLANGGWAKLPDLGYNSLGLANSLRAWLKRRRASSSQRRAEAAPTQEV